MSVQKINYHENHMYNSLKSPTYMHIIRNSHLSKIRYDHPTNHTPRIDIIKTNNLKIVENDCKH